jgi:hypothetical protein
MLMLRLPLSSSTALSGLAANKPGTRLHRSSPASGSGIFAERSTVPALPERRRTRIWELSNSLHCSIVGTCLSSAELRQVLVKLGVPAAETASEHDLHEKGVRLAGLPNDGAKFLHKALDRRHRACIDRFAKLRDCDALRALWAESVRSGEIPGAYWAVLTHPATPESLARQVFGEVHMLSHLVGAANRADIRRLRQLEEDNAALTAKVERQQLLLREGFTARDATIRRLNDLLVRTMTPPAESPPPEASDTAATDNAVAEISRRLAGETGRRERLERRVATNGETLRTAERARQVAEEERDALRRELDSVEGRIESFLMPHDASSPDATDLSGVAVLYVGGRASQTPRLRALVERAGAQFLHHDGGIEHSATLLPGLIGRADVTVFPVDCVSHDAMTSVKRHCRQSGKPYLALRTSSLTALLSALASVSQRDEGRSGA